MDEHLLFNPNGAILNELPMDVLAQLTRDEGPAYTAKRMEELPERGDERPGVGRTAGGRATCLGRGGYPRLGPASAIASTSARDPRIGDTLSSHHVAPAAS